MKLENRRTTYAINTQGGILFNNPEKVQRIKDMPLDLFEHSLVCLVLIAMFAVADLASFLQLFNAILYDGFALRLAMIIGMIAGMDIVPVYLGKALKRRAQGLDQDKTALLGLTAVFAGAILVNFFFRIAYKDAIAPVLSDSGTSLMGVVTQSEAAVDPRAIWFAIGTALVNTATSVGSLFISYFLMDPLKDEIRRQTDAKLRLQEDILMTRSILAEYDCAPDHFEQMEADERAKHQGMLNLSKELAIAYCDYVRQRIAEMTADPAATNELTKPSYEELSAKMTQMPESAGDEPPVDTEVTPPDPGARISSLTQAILDQEAS